MQNTIITVSDCIVIYIVCCRFVSNLAS